MGTLTNYREALTKARGYVEEPGEPGTVVQTTEASSERSKALLAEIDDLLAANPSEENMENEDIVRELRKVEDTLKQVKNHLHSKDAMNAALHMSEIRHTPLYSSVANAYATCIHLVNRLSPAEQPMPHE